MLRILGLAAGITAMLGCPAVAQDTAQNTATYLRSWLPGIPDRDYPTRQIERYMRERREICPTVANRTECEFNFALAVTYWGEVDSSMLAAELTAAQGEDADIPNAEAQRWLKLAQEMETSLPKPPPK